MRADLVAIEDEDVGAGSGELARDRQAGEARAADERRPAAHRPSDSCGRAAHALTARARSHGRGRVRPAEHVEAVPLDPVEDGGVHGPRERRSRGGPRGSPRRARASSPRTGPRARCTSVAMRLRSAGVAVPAARSSSLTPARSRSSAGQVDPVETVVLAHVPQEVRQLERDPEPRQPLGLGRGSEDRGHDPADRPAAALHVAVELGARLDPEAAAVHPHRRDVRAGAPQSGRSRAAAAWTSAAITGWSERPVARPRSSSALPVVERRPSLVRLELGPRIDDLVGAADEPVQRVHRGALLLRQPRDGEPVGRVVPAKHPPARRVCGLGRSSSYGHRLGDPHAAILRSGYFVRGPGLHTAGPGRAAASASW